VADNGQTEYLSQAGGTTHGLALRRAAADWQALWDGRQSRGELDLIIQSAAGAAPPLLNHYAYQGTLRVQYPAFLFSPNLYFDVYRPGPASPSIRRPL
jgi:hypothetical protein